MSIGDMVPWRNRNVVTRRGNQDPFLSLHNQVNRLFDEFARGFNLPMNGERGMAWPSVELKEDDKRYCVEAELPGMEEKDIELLLTDNVLTIRGEKHIEKDDAKQQYSERFFGRFERQIPLTTEVDPDAVKAKFKNGVLRVEIPKSAQAKERARRITVSR
jgi:HSP20 family protein